MFIKSDYNYWDLRINCWSGAIETLKTIEENQKEEELMELLKCIFPEVPTLTQVNDLLWFDDDFVLEQLGIEKEKEGENNE